MSLYETDSLLKVATITIKYLPKNQIQQHQITL